jgi:hypothetical protein
MVVFLRLSAVTLDSVAPPPQVHAHLMSARYSSSLRRTHVRRERHTHTEREREREQHTIYCLQRLLFINKVSVLIIHFL